mgnify:CR=1 FL=1
MSEKPPETEADFSRAVISLAKTLGYRVHRNWTEIHSPRDGRTWCVAGKVVMGEFGWSFWS